MKVDDPEFGVFQLVKNGVNFSDTPAALLCRPPKLGEHNQETLESLGYSGADIEDLRAKRVI
jgi:crotonobetainyl-CoA:carnitine CoA-transferase CaiB-like acyl-CoA transferase